MLGDAPALSRGKGLAGWVTLWRGVILAPPQIPRYARNDRGRKRSE